MIYIMEALAEPVSFIKIGYTKGVMMSRLGEDHAASRFPSIQTGCPHELRLVCVFSGFRIEGGSCYDSEPCDEKVLQRIYRDFRHRGEWFLYNEELKGLLSAVDGCREVIYGGMLNDLTMFPMRKYSHQNGISIHDLAISYGVSEKRVKAFIDHGEIKLSATGTISQFERSKFEHKRSTFYTNPLSSTKSKE